MMTGEELLEFCSSCYPTFVHMHLDGYGMQHAEAFQISIIYVVEANLLGH